jgi:phenylalanyl-tRNA synthetase alpha chain
MGIVEELGQLRQQALGELSAAADLAALAEWKSAYLGKQGALTKLSRGLGALPADERPHAGQQFNTTRQTLEQALEQAETGLKRAAQMNAFEAEQVDVTLPGRTASIGRMHPSTQMLRTISSAFAEMVSRCSRAQRSSRTN